MYPVYRRPKQYGAPATDIYLTNLEPNTLDEVQITKRSLARCVGALVSLQGTATYPMTASSF